MNDKLQQLRIDKDQKERSSRGPWMIFLAVAAVTGATVFYAWPRLSDKSRVFDGATKKTVADRSEITRKNEGGAAATGGAGASSSGNTATAAKPASPVPGRVEGSLLTVSGYIVNRERIEISPRFMGVVNWIGVKKGDAVTNGQVVVLLDDAEYRGRLAEAEGRLANARVSVEKAQLDFNRAAELVKSHVEMQKTEDDARLQLASARASVRENEGSVQVIKTYLDWCVIKSPINGVVLEKMVDPNELVTPQTFGGTRGPSTSLIAVADPKDLQVEIDVNEADLPKIFLQQKCKVSPEAYPDRVYDGYVAEVAPEASRQKGTLQIKVQIREPDRYLTPELSAKVDFVEAPPTGK
ncbi:MAG TPA: efflux RND transporter periplasmic adaptor subunit [Verrucomicrobiae bacterium]|nr:efflux RND transporter periplasmic adaptor subunit [Verrucomicrobiae bacterium]